MPATPVLIASYFTLAGNLIPFASTDPSPFDLAARADAAARAGYAGIGLETGDLRHCKDRHGYAGIRRILTDAGLTYLEFEVLTDWFTSGERRAASDAQRAFLLEAAGELGAQKIKTIGDAHGGMDNAIPRDWSLELLADAYGQLARDAARVGSMVTLELVPGTGVRDLPTARAIAEGANEPNAGLLIDIWHLARGGIAYEDVLALPPALINAVEIDDAMSCQEGSIFEDTIRRRKLPGEGELDVPRFLRCLMATGYDGVYGVEMVSDEHRARSLEDAAQRSFATTMSQFNAAMAASA
ncbi:MAG: sugar phosphate isomerase/epimerase family protein [Pseudomonadota bacterium]